MANELKEAQKTNDAVERRWENARKIGSVDEMYVATKDYENNIKKQEAEIKKMDPNSREYEKAQQKLDAQRQQKNEMERTQRSVHRAEGKQADIDKLETKNQDLSRQMDSAIKRGDMKTYDDLKGKYDKNVSAQEKLCSDAKEEGYNPKETIIQQKAAGVDKDCKIRDQLTDKANRGKQLSEQEQKQLQKSQNDIRKGEAEQLRYQNEKKLEGMRERGVSEKEIEQKRQEENKKITQR